MSNCKCGCGCGKDDVYSFMRKQLESGKSLEDVMKELTEFANRVEKERHYQEEFLKKYDIEAEELAKYMTAFEMKKSGNKFTKEEIESVVEANVSVLAFDTTRYYKMFKDFLKDFEF